MVGSFKLLALGMAMCWTLSVAHASRGPVDSDPLFPQELVGRTHIRAGLESLSENGAENTLETKALSTERRLVFCDASLDSIRSKFAFPTDIEFPADYQTNPRDYLTYGPKNLTLILGGGGSKDAVKLSKDSNIVILLPRQYFDSAKECHAYKSINAFGLISQQSPDLVTVQFRDGQQIENILSVTSFDFLAKDNQRRTWDFKNGIGFGDICIFNGADNFNSIEYNLRLLTPLARDLALWKFIYGVEGDIINIILKRTNNETQTICRLLLYDTGPLLEVYVKTTILSVLQAIERNPDYFKQLKCMSTMGWLYEEVCSAMLPQETLSLWGVEYRRGSGTRTNFKEVAYMWKKIEPHILKIFDAEVIRLAEFFRECMK